MPFVPISAGSTTRSGFVPLADSEDEAPAAHRGFTPTDDNDNPSERPSQLKTVAQNNPLTAVGETAANLGSQLISIPAAGLAGIATAAGNKLGLTDKDPVDVVHSVGNALTYQPRGEMGKAATSLVQYPFEKLAEGGQMAGDATLNATGSPLAATAVDTAVNALPMVLGIRGRAKPLPETERGFVPREEISVERTVERPTPTEPAPEIMNAQSIDEAIGQAHSVLSDSARSARAREASLTPEVDTSAQLPWTMEWNDNGNLIVSGNDAVTLGPELRREIPGLSMIPKRMPDGTMGVMLSRHADPSAVTDALHTINGRRNPPRVEEVLDVPAAESEVLPVVDPGTSLESPATLTSPWTIQRTESGGLEIGGRIDDIQALLPELRRELPDTSLLRRSNPDSSMSLVVSRRIDEPALRQAIDNVRSRFLPPSVFEQWHTKKTQALPETSPRYDGITYAQNDSVAAPELHAMAPGANYAPFVGDARAAVTADGPRTEPITRESILSPLLESLDATIYQGRIKGERKLGHYRPKLEEVRIKRSGDIETAAHEIAHLIDDRVPEVSAAWKQDKELNAELRSVSYDHTKVNEGFAESMRLFLTQPEVLQARAPKVHGWLEDFTKNHEYGPALLKAQEGMTAWFAQDGINRARSKIGKPIELNAAFDGLWDKFRQSVSDDLHGVYRMERDLTGTLKPNGAYESARLSRASASIADGALRYGAPVRKADGSNTWKGKGLEEILKPVSSSLEDALLYFVGKSSAELMQQGREHLFSPGEVSAMLKLKTPERDAAFKDYQAWNQGILDFAEANGVINPAARAMWQRQAYLPFHRVGTPDGYKGKPGDWSGIKALTGGTDNLRDVLGNMTANAAQLIDKAVKNEARQKIAELATERGGGRFMVKIDAESRPVKVDKKAVLDGLLQTLGIDRAQYERRGEKLPAHVRKMIKALEDDLANSPGMMEFYVGNQPPAGGNVVAVLHEGKPTWYEVADPILYRALAAIDRPDQPWIVKWLGLPKRVGQATITLTPDFMVGNVARDTIMASVMSRAGFMPIMDSLKGMRSRVASDPVYRDYIANGGGLSSIYLDEGKFRAKLENFYNKQGVDYRTVLDTPDKMLGFIETLGDAFEASSRLGEFKRATDKGENPRHAAYLGREVSTDFAMTGDNKALSFMYNTVMFLRPAVLSLDRLYRGVAHDPNKGAIAIKTGMLALMSSGLYLLNRDNPHYRDMEDWKKDANWHFYIPGLDGKEQHFMWPKIWEIGAIASVAERSTEKLLAHDPEGLGKDFARIVGQTFGINFMPQIAAPLAEQYANKNSFTRAPIETEGMENLQPFLRAKPGTSETLKALGMATRDVIPDDLKHSARKMGITEETFQVNPVRTEALLRGYFNTWALYGLALADKAFFDAKGPTKRLDEMPVVRRFYTQEPAQHTKYEEEFYDMLGEAKRLHGTLHELDKIGQTEIADEKEKNPLASESKPLERAAKNLQGINQEMRQVRRLDISPDEKRQRLDALMVERNALLKDTVTDAKAAQNQHEKEVQ